MSPSTALALRLIINVVYFCAESVGFSLASRMEKGDGGFRDVFALFGPCIVYALRFSTGVV
jgi:hypothetical protein